MLEIRPLSCTKPLLKHREPSLRSSKSVSFFSPRSQSCTSTRAGFRFKPNLSLSRSRAILALKTEGTKPGIANCASKQGLCLIAAGRHPPPGQPLIHNHHTDLVSTSTPQTTYLIARYSSLYELLITMILFVFALNRCPGSIRLILSHYLPGLSLSCGRRSPFPSEFYSLH